MLLATTRGSSWTDRTMGPLGGLHFTAKLAISEYDRWHLFVIYYAYLILTYCWFDSKVDKQKNKWQLWTTLLEDKQKWNKTEYFSMGDKWVGWTFLMRFLKLRGIAEGTNKGHSSPSGCLSQHYKHLWGACLLRLCGVVQWQVSTGGTKALWDDTKSM